MQPWMLKYGKHPIKGRSPPPTWDSFVDIVLAGRPRAAPGPDGVNRYLLSCAPRQTLRQHYHDTLAAWNDSPPEQWCEAEVILLPKTSSPRTIGDYRPITLLNDSLKILLLHLLKHWQETAEHSLLLSDSQCGFRRSRRTVDLVHGLQLFTRRHQGSYAVFVDLKRAFDSVPLNLLWDLLRLVGLPPGDVEWLASIYSKTRSSPRWAGRKCPAYKHLRGVKQGCPLSPFAFIIFFDFILKELAYRMSLGTTGLLLAFADDLALVHASAEFLQRAVLVLHDILRDLGLQINLTKTAFQAFNRPPASINLSNHVWPTSDTKCFKYLGMLLFSTDPEAQQYLLLENIITTFFSPIREGGFPAVPLAILVNSILIPRVCYILQAANTSQPMLQRLERKLWLSFAAATSLHPQSPPTFRHTPRHQAGLGLYSISLLYHWQFLALAPRYLSQQFPLFVAREFRAQITMPTPLRERLLQAAASFGLHVKGVSMQPPLALQRPQLPPCPAQFVLGGPDPRGHLLLHPQQPVATPLEETSAFLYTDGSYSTGGAGAAALWVTQAGTSLHASPYTPISSTYSEVKALSLAMKNIPASASGATVTWYCDSSAAISVVQGFMKTLQPRPSSPYLLDLDELRLHLAQFQSFTPTWVPAHSQIAGNEIADVAAKWAANVGPQGQRMLQAAPMFSFLTTDYLSFFTGPPRRP